jgi:hypothetical protein
MPNELRPHARDVVALWDEADLPARDALKAIMPAEGHEAWTRAISLLRASSNDRRRFNWGLEEWLRMFRKRVAKLEEVKQDNPHAAVELKKRLLQTAVLAIALMGIIDRDGVPWAASSSASPSNLPQFSEPTKP